MITELRGIPIKTDFREAMDALSQDQHIAFDLETNGLSPWRNQIATIQMYGKDTGIAALFHPRGRLPTELRELFEDPTRTFYGHNIAQFDTMFLASHGVDLSKATWYDTLVAETVVAGYGRKNISMTLKEALSRRLGIEVTKGVDHGGWMNEHLTDEQIAYAMDDVLHLHALVLAQREKAVETNQLSVIDFEVSLTPAVMAMQLNGYPLNLETLSAYLAKQYQLADEDSEILFGLLGKRFNVNSPAQLKVALAGRGIDLPSTAEPVLTEAAMTYRANNQERQAQLLELVLELRGAYQRIKMYGDDFVDENVTDSRIHPRYRQCGADTGRFTCRGPNMQQVPKDMRAVFEAPEGSSIISVDYSQIEVRVAAYLAKDRALAEALQQEDFHTAIASMVFGVPMDQVSKLQRRISKSMSFTLLFAGSARTLHEHARHAGATITLEEAEDMRYRFFARFSGLARMIDKANDLAHSKSVVWITLPNGLKRMLLGDKIRTTVIMNTAIQGAAGVGLKRGMILAHQRGLSQYLIGTVHDEVVACAPDDVAKDVGDALSCAMIDGMSATIKLPVATSIQIAKTWAG